MIGQIAAMTTRMRVGSGGVMLPNHAPLMVAERFKVLEALFPGRIDLGLGRAPGTDPVTSYALRRRQDAGGDDDFLQRFQELILFESKRLSGKPSLPRRSAPCRKTSRCRRSGCWARAATVRNSPPWSAPDIHSPSFRRSRSGRRDAELSRPVQAVRGARHTICHSRLRRGLRRQRCRGGAARLHHRSQFRAPATRRISAAGEPRGGCGLSVCARRAQIDRAQPRPPVRRQQSDGAGAAGDR